VTISATGTAINTGLTNLVSDVLKIDTINATDSTAIVMDVSQLATLSTKLTADDTITLNDSVTSLFGASGDVLVTSLTDNTNAVINAADSVVITGGSINIAKAAAINSARGDLDEVTYSISDTAANIMANPDLVANATSVTITEDTNWAADWKTAYSFDQARTMTSTDVAIIGATISANEMTSVAVNSSDVDVTYNGFTLKITGITKLAGTELVFDDGTLVKLGDATASDTMLGSNIISTTSGDYLSGSGGNDVIRGLAGTDKLFGGIGSDILYGGNGADTIQGDAGNDLLYGGDSSANDGAIDTFNYTKSIVGGEGNDLIVGFNPNQDIIHFIGGTGIGTDVNVAASGSNTVVTLTHATSGTTKITLIGVLSSAIDLNDFSFGNG
jgi:Ca2+-binding RTX toxin-like protein